MPGLCGGDPHLDRQGTGRHGQLTAALTGHATNAALLLGDQDTAERLADEGYRLDGQFGTWTRAILEFGALKASVPALPDP